MLESIIKKEDLIEKAHWPVMTLVGCYEDDFPTIVKGFSEGRGNSYQDASSLFWEQLDEYDQEHEKHFDGVLFYDMDDECVISFSELYDYLSLACIRYSERYPEVKPELDCYLAAYKEKYLD